MENVCLSKLPPVNVWGLDPLHRCGIKLFIRQINHLPQIIGFPGNSSWKRNVKYK